MHVLSVSLLVVGALLLAAGIYLYYQNFSKISATDCAAKDLQLFGAGDKFVAGSVCYEYQGGLCYKGTVASDGNSCVKNGSAVPYLLISTGGAALLVGVVLLFVKTK